MPFNFTRQNLFGLILIILLVISFWVRVSKADYPLAADGGEGGRDYLAGHALLKHGEFPLTGPGSGTTRNFIKNSPVYYYLIASILLINDNVLFLGYVNIVLQLFVVGLIFLLGYKLFNKYVGLVGAILYSFTPEILRHSGYMWQPYFMAPFALLGLSLIFICFKRAVTGNYKDIKKTDDLYIYLGLFFLILAAAIHNSVYAVLIPSLLLVFYILFLKSRRYYEYFLILIFCLLVIYLLYIPVIFLLTGQHSTSLGINYLLVDTFGGYFLNIKRSFFVFLHIFSFEPINNLRVLSTWLFNFVLVITVIYFFREKSYRRKISAVFVFFVAWQIILASVFSSTQVIFQLIPVLPLFAIFISEVIISNFSKNLITRLVAVILIFLLFMTFSKNFSFIKSNESKNLKVISEVPDVIVGEVNDLRLRGVLNEEIGFKSFRTGSYDVSDAVLLIPLEKKLGWSFVKENYFTYSRLLDKRYIFLGCFSFEKKYELSSCQEDLLKYFKYNSIKLVYTSEELTMYLAAK